MKNRIISFLCAFIFTTLSFYPNVVFASGTGQDLLESIANDNSVFMHVTMGEDDDGNEVITNYEYVMHVSDEVESYLNDDGIIVIDGQMYFLKISAVDSDGTPYSLSGNSVGAKKALVDDDEERICTLFNTV